jgi:signal transduction histidine kinase
MGIGAYECREHVHSLGGEIRVESEPGKGTRLLVTLPLAGEQQAGEYVHENMESTG